MGNCLALTSAMIDNELQREAVKKETASIKREIRKSRLLISKLQKSARDEMPGEEQAVLNKEVDDFLATKLVKPPRNASQSSNGSDQLDHKEERSRSGRPSRRGGESARPVAVPTPNEQPKGESGQKSRSLLQQSVGKTKSKSFRGEARALGLAEGEEPEGGDSTTRPGPAGGRTREADRDHSVGAE